MRTLSKIKALFHTRAARGLIKDLPDARDLLRNPKPTSYPERFSLQAQGRKAALDQGSTSACTGFASSAFMSSLHGAWSSGRGWEASPMFIYYKAREAYGTLDIDSGAPLREVMKVLHQTGACPLSMHPSLSDWRQRPSVEAVRAAQMMRIKDYQRILPMPNAPEVMMQTLFQEKLPIIAGIMLFPSSNSTSVKFSGNIPMPAPGEAGNGGHAIMLDGYDVGARMFHGWNSWGSGWGNGGRLAVPFDYFTRMDLCFDIWTVSYLYW